MADSETLKELVNLLVLRDSGFVFNFEGEEPGWFKKLSYAYKYPK